MSVPIYPSFNGVKLGFVRAGYMISSAQCSKEWRKKPLMQIRKKGRKKQPLIRLFHEQNSLKWTLMQWAFWENTASVNKPTAGNKKIPKAFIPSVLSSGILSSATAWRRGKKTCPGFGPGCSAVPAWQEGLTAYTRGLYSTEHLVLNKR